MIDVNGSTILAHWTISKGFTGFDGKIDDQSNYLTKVQINHVQNEIKSLAHYEAIQNLKALRDPKANTLPEPSLDKPDDLSETAFRVVGFLGDAGKGFDRLGKVVNVMCNRPFSKVFKDLNEVSSRKSPSIQISDMCKICDLFLQELHNGLNLVQVRVKEKLDEVDWQMANLREEIKDETTELSSEIENVKKIIVVFDNQGPEDRELLRDVTLSINMLGDAIVRFEEGDAIESDLIESIERIENVVYSYNAQGHMFRFNPISLVKMIVDGKEIPVLDVVLSNVQSLKVLIGNESNLLAQLNALEDSVMEFGSVSDAVLKSYSIHGQVLTENFLNSLTSFKNTPVTNENEFIVSGKIKILKEQFVSKLDEMISSKTGSITRIFLKCLNLTEKKPEEKWDSSKYLLSEELSAREIDLSKNLDEMWGDELQFQLDDIDVIDSLKEKRTPETPNAIAELNLSRIGSTRLTPRPGSVMDFNLQRKSAVEVSQMPFVEDASFSIMRKAKSEGGNRKFPSEVSRPIAAHPVKNNFQGFVQYMEPTNIQAEVVLPPKEEVVLAKSQDSIQSVESETSKSSASNECFFGMDEA